MNNDLSIFLKAASFAAEKHRDQRRKNVDASPYINHCLKVAHILAEVAAVSDINLLCAAVLHDTVEDTETTFEEIEQTFGRQVRDFVAEVTDDKSLPKSERKSLQVENASKKSSPAKMLKIADKICNVDDMDLSSPKGWELERKQAYCEWAEQVVCGCRGICDSLDQQFDETLLAAKERLKS